jgi:hypothetical protein
MISQIKKKSSFLRIVKAIILGLLASDILILVKTFRSYFIWLLEEVNSFFLNVFNTNFYLTQPKNYNFYDPDRYSLLVKIEYEALLYPFCFILFLLLVFILITFKKAEDYSMEKTQKKPLLQGNLISLFFVLMWFSIFFFYAYLIYFFSTEIPIWTSIPDFYSFLWNSHLLLRVLLCIFFSYPVLVFCLNYALVKFEFINKKRLLIFLVFFNLCIIYHYVWLCIMLYGYSFAFLDPNSHMIPCFDYILASLGISSLCIPSKGMHMGDFSHNVKKSEESYSSSTEAEPKVDPKEDFGPCKEEYDSYKYWKKAESAIPSKLPRGAGGGKARKIANIIVGGAEALTVRKCAKAKEAFDLCLDRFRLTKEMDADKKA